MKKRWFILIVVMLIGLTACTSSQKATTALQTPAPSKTEATPSPTEAPTTEIVSPTKTEEETTVYVFIAASLTNVMEDIQENYKKVAPNVTLIFNADSSGTLKTQIEEGAECDIFFSAAKKQMTELTEGGYIVDGSVVSLLENKVVLIHPTGMETSVSSFETITEAKSLALAGEDVPVGAYAREIFTNLKILDQVMEMEINQGANVSAVLAAVSEASNEVGVVYATDAASVADKVEIICEAPEGSLQSPVIYPVGLVMNKEAEEVQAKASAEFLVYLQGEDSLALFEKYGFSIHNQNGVDH